MLLTFAGKKSVFWSSTMTVEFVVLVLSVLARVNGQWGHENNEDASTEEGDSCQLKTSEPGICKRLSSCAVYYEGLKQKTIKYSILVRCSFIDTEEVICCPIEERSTGDATTGRGIPKTTAKPTTKTTTTRRPTTTTTTMQPIIVGGKTIRGNEPFIDLFSILSTTTKRPQQNMLGPRKPLMNINSQQIIPPSFNTGVQNPWIGNGNINNNNNQWSDQRIPQNQQRPFIQQNNVRFPIDLNVLSTTGTNINFPGPMAQSLPQPLPTDPSLKTEAVITEENNIFKQYEFRGSDSSNGEGKSGTSSQVVSANSDVEVFNTINTSSDSSNNKLVQFPGQVTLTSPQTFATNSFPKTTQTVQLAKQNNVFEQFEFRPGSDDSSMKGNSGRTERTIWKLQQVIPVDQNVEVFNSIDTDSSNKLVQFPGPMMGSPPPQSFKTNSFPKTERIIVEQNDIFDSKFRPGFDDSNAGDNRGTVLGWSTPNSERSDTTNSRRTTTTTIGPSILENWMQESLDQVSTSTSFVVKQNDIIHSKFRPGFDDSNAGDNRGTVLGWSTPNSDRSDTTNTRRTTTTTSTTIGPPILENWMQESLDQVSTSTSRPSVTATSSLATEATPVEAVTTRTIGNGRPSQVACKSYREFNPAGLTFHILDGLPVEPGEFPHIGGLIFPQGGGADVDNRCGSSLISERYVMTAAHCVNDPLSLPTFVRLGVVIWNSKDEEYPPVDVEIENITLHPEYRSHLRYHDIALIRLRNDIAFTTLIRPACLNSDVQDIDANTPLAVIGWGVTNVQTRARSEILLMTNVTTVPLQDCNATHIAYGTSRAYRSGLNEGHYCAFDPELKKDACQSDSGGPLQLVRNKESTIVGIVSFGLSCGSAIPSVYVRVAYYLDWIEGIVWPS